MGEFFLTSVDGEIQGVDGQDSQGNRRSPRQFCIIDKEANNLLCKAQDHETARYNDGSHHPEGAPTTPFGCVFVCYNTNDWLDDEARERTRDPYQRGIGFGEAEIEQIRGAILVSLVAVVSCLDGRFLHVWLDNNLQVISIPQVKLRLTALVRQGVQKQRAQRNSRYPYYAKVEENHAHRL